MIGRRTFVTVLMLGGACGFSACGDTTGFGEMSQIQNEPDRFEFVVSELKHYTGTHQYPWTSSGAAVSVYQSSAVTGGSAQLAILDAEGTQVYARSLAESGTFDSTRGTPGTWTIRISFTAMMGTVTFRVLKSPLPAQ